MKNICLNALTHYVYLFWIFDTLNSFLCFLNNHFLYEEAVMLYQRVLTLELENWVWDPAHALINCAFEGNWASIICQMGILIRPHGIGCKQWWSDKCSVVSLWGARARGGRKPWVTGFVDFCGLRTPITANFRLSVWWHWTQIWKNVPQHIIICYFHHADRHMHLNNLT